MGLPFTTGKGESKECRATPWRGGPSPCTLGRGKQLSLALGLSSFSDIGVGRSKDASHWARPKSGKTRRRPEFASSMVCSLGRHSAVLLISCVAGSSLQDIVCRSNKGVLGFAGQQPPIRPRDDWWRPECDKEVLKIATTMQHFDLILRGEEHQQQQTGCQVYDSFISVAAGLFKLHTNAGSTGHDNIMSSECGDQSVSSAGKRVYLKSNPIFYDPE